jgi:hypothetical protein
MYLWALSMGGKWEPLADLKQFGWTTIAQQRNLVERLRKFAAWQREQQQQEPQ